MNAVIRHNLLTRPGYTPYCGASCNSMPRTRFDGEQFRCEDCGWVSSFEPEFIARYKLADAIARKAQALGHTAELGEKYATLRNNETGCAIPFASHKEAAVWLLVREGRPHFRGLVFSIGESLKLTSVSELAHKLEEQAVLEALTRPPKEQRPRPVAQSAPMGPERLDFLFSRLLVSATTHAVASEIRVEVDRLRSALQHIADGNISPSIRFARLVLDGAAVKDAHRQEHERMFGQ